MKIHPSSTLFTKAFPSSHLELKSLAGFISDLNSERDVRVNLFGLEHMIKLMLMQVYIVQGEREA